MNLQTARHTALLTSRFMRSRALVLSTSVVFLVALCLMAMYVTLATLALSGRQVADRDLGRFGAAVGYGSIALEPGDGSFGADVMGRLPGGEASGAMAMLSATEFQLATTPAREVTLLEGHWAHRPYPDRYALLSGRWPTSPGEVVVTEPGDVRAVAGTTLAAMGGRVRLRVVGTADDRFARTSTVLAAPRTWASLDPRLLQGFPRLRAQPFLLWSGRSAGQVIDAVAAVVAQRQKGDGARETVAATLMTRQQLASRPERSSIERSPAGYTVPLLLLTPGAVILVFGLNNRRFRRSLAVLRAVGVRPALGVVSLSLAALTWCLAAAATGGATGAAVGAVARMVLAEVRDRPPGPVSGLVSGLVPSVLSLMGLIVVGTVCAGLALARGGSSARSQRSGPTGDGRPGGEPVRAGRFQKLGRDLRHVLAAVAWSAVIVFAGQVDSPAKAMVLSGLLTAAVLLLTPELTRLLLRVLPERGPRGRLARRRLAADTVRLNASVAVLTVLLSMSVGYLTLFDTLVRTLAQESFPDVLPGQVLVTHASSTVLRPPGPIVELADVSVPPAAGRAQLRYLLELDGTGEAERSATLEGSAASILALDSVDHVRQLLTQPLSTAQQTVLRDGGLLIWADAERRPRDPAARAPLVVKSAGTVISRTVALPLAVVDVPRSGWRTGTDAVMLTARARQLGMPVTSGAILYSGLSEAQAMALQRDFLDAGVDGRSVQLHTPPPPIIPRAAFVLTAVGLVALLFLGGLAVTSGQTRALRGYLGQLTGLGLSTGWARQILLYEHGVVLAFSTLPAAFIAIVPIFVLVSSVSGFTLSIPWGQLLVLSIAIYLGVTLTALRSARGLRARTSLMADD
ncbi:hypothetical protein ACQEUU_25275 [Nonomuraea sp. CA-218870]|uniref:hypothetical protein n=1 Tax=Nonomuraea sp. CA-218870 TaxID=3239998 RepID=UPI003D941ED5